MHPDALRWLQDFEEAKKMLTKGDTVVLTRAFELFTRSAKSFPDSYVAAQCHAYRATILHKKGMEAEARQEELRMKERYVIMNNE
jgi:hypothetical protein